MIDVNKHENNFDDRRGYIKLYRTGTAAGSTGPTMLLLSVKIPRRVFNYKFLMKYGTALGLGIIMTETAYMTNISWEYMTPKII